jgi:hypothetical protein
LPKRTNHPAALVFHSGEAGFGYWVSSHKRRKIYQTDG